MDRKKREKEMPNRQSYSAYTSQTTQAPQKHQPKNQQKKLRKQVGTKKFELKQLITSAKEKLKSKSKFFETKRKERNKKLESFFETFPANQHEVVKSLENIKTGLSKRLTMEEINNLCQAQIELVQLKLELKNLQEQGWDQITQIQQATTAVPYGIPSSSRGTNH